MLNNLLRFHLGFRRIIIGPQKFFSLHQTWDKMLAIQDRGRFGRFLETLSLTSHNGHRNAWINFLRFVCICIVFRVFYMVMSKYLYLAVSALEVCISSQDYSNFITLFAYNLYIIIQWDKLKFSISAIFVSIQLS